MPGPFALTGAGVVVGDAEGTVLPGMTVVVGGDGNIERVGASAETPVPRGYRAVDTTGRFVVPGLINAHAHLFSDGRPLPAILVKESLQGVVSAFSRSPLGRLLFTRRARANIRTQLHSGVTTIRSVGDVAYEVVAVAKEIDSGEYPGPRVRAAGRPALVPAQCARRSVRCSRWRSARRSARSRSSPSS